MGLTAELRGFLLSLSVESPVTRIRGWMRAFDVDSAPPVGIKDKSVQHVVSR